jgi:hypothetical protein
MIHYGALTDGRDWGFYIVDSDAFFMKFITADTCDNIILILGRCSDFLIILTLGILTRLYADRFPIRDDTAVIWY